MVSKKYFFYLWIGCLLSTLAILPYTHFLGLTPVLNWKIVLGSLVQPAVIFGVILWLSYVMLQKVDLKPFLVKSPLLKQVVIPGVVVGLLVGLVIFFLEKWAFSQSALVKMSPPYWAGFLASFYGGFNEEVLCRLFLLTAFYFLLTRVVKDHRSLLLGFATVLAAGLFAAGHLPALYSIISSPSAFEVTRVIVLNSIAGIVFGWLYCTKGFWTAVVAHFTTDLVIHVFLA